MSRTNVDMLGPLTRALVGVPTHRLSLMADIANRMSSSCGDSRRWYTTLSERMRVGLLDPQLTTAVRVDRTVVKDVFPGGVKVAFLHPDLVGVGPTDYDIAGLEALSYHARTYQDVYLHLKAKKMIRRCLGNEDLYAIANKRAEVFRDCISGQGFGDRLYAWRSTAKCNNEAGEEVVPYLWDDKGELIHGSMSLTDPWSEERDKVFLFPQ